MSLSDVLRKDDLEKLISSNRDQSVTVTTFALLLLERKDQYDSGVAPHKPESY